MYGNASDVDPDCASLLNRLLLIFHSKSPQTICKIPELDQILEKASNSLEKGEVVRLIGIIHHYINQNYIDVPICDTNQDIATSKRIPKWDPGKRRMGFNLNDLIRQ